MADEALPAIKLYVIPGSHPAMAARRMLELKGIPYKRVDLMPVISRAALKAMRFPSNTVPSLAIGERKLTGSRAIAEELDRLRPDPPLYPSEHDARVTVEEAERWGEEMLQPAARRISWNVLQARPLAAGELCRGRPARGADRACRQDRGADRRRREPHEQRRRRGGAR